MIQIIIILVWKIQVLFLLYNKKNFQGIKCYVIIKFIFIIIDSEILLLLKKILFIYCIYYKK